MLLQMVLVAIVAVHGSNACCDGQFHCACNDSYLASVGSHVVYDFAWLLRDYVIGDAKTTQLRTIIDQTRKNPRGAPGQCLSLLPKVTAKYLPPVADDCVYLHGGLITPKLAAGRFMFAACDDGATDAKITLENVFFAANESLRGTWIRFGYNYMRELILKKPQQIIDDICGPDGVNCVNGPSQKALNDYMSLSKGVLTDLSNLLQGQSTLVALLGADTGAKEVAEINAAVQALLTLTADSDDCGHLAAMNVDERWKLGEKAAHGMAAVTGHSELSFAANSTALDESDDRADLDFYSLEERKVCDTLIDVKNANVTGQSSGYTQLAWTRVEASCFPKCTHAQAKTSKESTVCGGHTGDWYPPLQSCFQLCEPLTVEHSNIAEKPVVENRHSHMTPLVVKCDADYTHFATLNDTQTVTCTNGQWLPAAHCGLHCQSYDPVDQATVESPFAGPVQPTGSHVTVTCAPGHTLNQTCWRNLSINCNESVWSWRDQLNRIQTTGVGCVRECLITNYTNAKITKPSSGKNKTLPDSVCTGATGYQIQCVNGTSFRGEPTIPLSASLPISCVEGEWQCKKKNETFVSECVPRCAPLRTQRATFTGGADPTHQMQNDARVVGVTCDVNNTVDGTQAGFIELRCAAGDWLPREPECLKMCPSIRVKNAKINGSDAIDGMVPAAVSLTVACDEKFSVNRTYTKERKLTCVDGRWDPTVECTVMCPPLSVLYGKMSGRGENVSTVLQPLGTTMNITCNSGQTATVVCTETGEWWPPIPACGACPMNLIFAIENGREIDEEEFRQAKLAMEGLIDKLYIGKSVRKTSFALMSFSSSVVVSKRLQDCDGPMCAHAAIQSLRPSTETGTDIEGLLTKAKDDILWEPIMKDNQLLCKSNVLLLFLWNTNSGKNPKPVSIDLRQYRNLKIYAVDLSPFNASTIKELETITGGRERVLNFWPANTTNITSLTDTITMSCQAYDEPPSDHECTNDPEGHPEHLDDEMIGMMMCTDAAHAAGCEGIDDYPYYRCKCQDGWSCDMCETSTQQCKNASLFCSHAVQGSCMNCDYCGKPVCICETGYRTNWMDLTSEGKRQCDDDINECDTRHCDNGGICVNTIGSYHCECASGWSGPTCTQPAGCCYKSPCQNTVECGTGANCDKHNLCKCKLLSDDVNPWVSCSYASEIPSDVIGGSLDDGGLTTYAFDDYAHTRFSIPTSCPFTFVRTCRSLPHIEDFHVLLTSVGDDTTVRVNKVIFTFNKMVFTFDEAFTNNEPFFYFNGVKTLFDKQGTWEKSCDNHCKITVKANNPSKTEPFSLSVKTTLSVFLKMLHPADTFTSVTVTMPNSAPLNGKVCGLAGNRNGHSDDDRLLHDGSTAPDDDTFVDDWASDTFPRFGASGCLFSRAYRARDHFAAMQTRCKFLSDENGPFAPCLNVMSGFEIAAFYRNCTDDIADLCAQNPQACTDEKTLRSHACSQLEPFASVCRERLVASGVMSFLWRKIVDCPDLDCADPETMETDSYAIACQDTCDCQDAHLKCPITIPVERCVCKQKRDALGSQYFVFRDVDYQECIDVNDCPNVPPDERCQKIPHH